MKSLKTPLYSGVITNYHCSAACRHCMFASAPTCSGAYMTENCAEKTAALLSRAGCTSVHIGGGEPFMNFAALCTVIEILKKHGIDIDYIETNASWCINDDIVRERLKRLRLLGVTTVMASVDPFHIEYVPLERPLRLCRLLAEEGFDYFIWQEKFLRKLIDLDHSRTYTGDELKRFLGEDYVSDTAAEYGLGMNGRALVIAEEMYEKKDVSHWLTSSPCPSLSRPHHCHLDLYGNAVPSGCPGLAAESEDYLTGRFPADKYPVFSRLSCGGIRELYSYALNKGFTPDMDGYPSKCALCYAIRSYLHQKSPSPDLAPDGFYEEMAKLTK